ncbi:DUF2141 domain-containing protein [Ferriphaselus sp. R-1]|uniref:DUF2141 domain-containing protein n=1 Tax=Ferriphaselus sp. R-1 TaxID=1485544 RepID=UPI0005547B6C|nr:DUF2141 domain-containing protein [Ferriphaselus sp. R-1]
MRAWIGAGAWLLMAPVWGGDLELTVLGGPPGMPVRVALYESATDFGDSAGHGALREQQGQMADGAARFFFPGLKAGRYAVASYADLNGNHRLDSNFLGKPTEPYGFSRDARSVFGIPDFERAAIHVGDGHVVQTIQLK